MQMSPSFDAGIYRGDRRKAEAAEGVCEEQNDKENDVICRKRI